MRILLPIFALFLIAGCNSAESESRKIAVPASTAASASMISSAPMSEAKVTAAHNSTMNASSVTAPELLHKNDAPSAAMLYQKCAACHGTHGEKSALNQSQPIADWDAERIVNAIDGYLDGSYGGAMKVLMKNQVKDLNRAQIEALALYISNLNMEQTN